METSSPPSLKFGRRELALPARLRSHTAVHSSLAAETRWLLSRASQSVAAAAGRWRRCFRRWRSGQSAESCRSWCGGRAGAARKAPAPSRCGCSSTRNHRRRWQPTVRKIMAGCALRAADPTGTAARGCDIGRCRVAGIDYSLSGWFAIMCFGQVVLYDEMINVDGQRPYQAHKHTPHTHLTISLSCSTGCI